MIQWCMASRPVPALDLTGGEVIRIGSVHGPVSVVHPQRRRLDLQVGLLVSLPGILPLTPDEAKRVRVAS